MKNYRYSLVIPCINRAPKENYIQRTYKSMEQSGILAYPHRSIDIFDSGSEDHSYLNFLKQSPVTVHLKHSRITLNQNHSRALKYGSKLDCDFVMFIEDDVEFCPDFMNKANQFINKYPNARMWSFYASYGEVNTRFQNGFDFWDMNCKGFYGSLCYAIRKQDAAVLSGFIQNHASRGIAIGADILVAKWLEKKYGKGTVVKCSVPSYVQHIGRESSIGSKWINNNSFNLNFRK